MKSLKSPTRKRVDARLVRRCLALAVPLAGSISTGCTRYVAVDPVRGPQAYYQTGFPAQDMSGALERTLASVVRIQAEGSYDRYVLSGDDAGLASLVQRPSAEVLARAVDTVSWRRSSAASAVIVASSRERLTLLTTDHAIDFPDTIVEYFDSQEPGAVTGRGPGAIESISIKYRQTYVIVTPSQVEPFEILARNGADDLALVGVTLPREADSPLIPVPARRPEAPVLELAKGDPGRLSWGSFVYLVGYPNGLRMVTRGIVSEPDRRDTAFLIDGLWNEGMSGAPILAVRGDGSGLEWVGIARAASALSEYRLVTEEAAERTQDPRRPYEGPVYLREVLEIRYGISFSVPVTTIRRFVEVERARLRDLGYPVPSL